MNEELAESYSLIQDAARGGRYWIAPRQLPTGTWAEYRTDVATTIEDAGGWFRITAAYDQINNLNWTVDHRRRTSGDTAGHQLGFPVEPGDQTREVWRSVRAAIETLEELLGVPPPASRVSGPARQAAGIERSFWPYGDGADFDAGQKDADDAHVRDQDEVRPERRATPIPDKSGEQDR
ncbi:hypothetical protein [Baekduia alba]|uniref:hypothetical protein n=1 Tax=Baekduia alba TaxID=2997333 RepID=UPI0023419C98|nr:hypothetical protein [Baekduia alba]